MTAKISLQMRAPLLKQIFCRLLNIESTTAQLTTCRHMTEHVHFGTIPAKTILIRFASVEWKPNTEMVPVDKKTAAFLDKFASLKGLIKFRVQREFHFAEVAILPMTDGVTAEVLANAARLLFSEDRVNMHRGKPKKLPERTRTMQDMKPPMIRYQACIYNTDAHGEPRAGLAKLTDGFDSSNVEFIIDSDLGVVVAENKLWSYKLTRDPVLGLTYHAIEQSNN